ncbi:hypothetical protein FHS59_004171 [Algoriphagus iocasae]|uniref:Uncharacterized protein n=1 Tax=Algoriphagus iocasae TaxID=1836499 RepID=A0A841N1G6_9BACT|nr:hypothetical protein [Algoriphagus iocasae]
MAEFERVQPFFVFNPRKGAIDNYKIVFKP